jgi:hypothetical protein
MHGPYKAVIVKETTTTIRNLPFLGPIGLPLVSGKEFVAEVAEGRGSWNSVVTHPTQ